MSKGTLQDYQPLDVCGKGSFGVVRKVRRKSDGIVMVWKQLNYGKMKQKEKQQIVSEVNILRELKHPNIVRYYDRIIDKSKSTIYIIMQYCQGGDIGRIIKRSHIKKDPIDQDVIWKVLLQITNALSPCHRRKEGVILHRDLKPSNIFLDKDFNVKLGDFGLSRQLGEDSIFAYTHVGTPYYQAPEQCQKHCKYDQKSDIWALGCIIYQLAALEPPFKAKNQLELSVKIKNDDPLKLPSRYSDQINRVVFWMLSKKIKDRPSVEDLLNVPQLSLRLREGRLKDNILHVKKRESEFKKNKVEHERKEQELKEREKKLIEEEKRLQEWQKELENRERELNQMLPPTPQQTRKKTVIGTSKGQTSAQKSGSNYHSGQIVSNRNSVERMSYEKKLQKNSSQNLDLLPSPCSSSGKGRTGSNSVRRSFDKGINSGRSNNNHYPPPPRILNTNNNPSNPGTPSARKSSKGRNSAQGNYLTSNSGKKNSNLSINSSSSSNYLNNIPSSFNLRADSPSAKFKNLKQYYPPAPPTPTSNILTKNKHHHPSSVLSQPQHQPHYLGRCNSAKRRNQGLVGASPKYGSNRNTSRTGRTQLSRVDSSPSSRLISSNKDNNSGYERNTSSNRNKLGTGKRIYSPPSSHNHHQQQQDQKYYGRYYEQQRPRTAHYSGSIQPKRSGSRTEMQDITNRIKHRTGIYY